MKKFLSGALNSVLTCSDSLAIIDKIVGECVSV